MSRCKQDMLDEGATLVPRTCPVHGLQRCRPAEARRRGDWMLTASGGEFWPLDPRSEEIWIEDIAHALSQLCRFGGHCKKFYSVAEHSVHVANAAPEHLKLAALLHDASEAYLQDVIRPIKVHLTNYLTIEAQLEREIAGRFGLSWPMPAEVKRLDERILADERAQVCVVKTTRVWSHWTPVEPLGVTLNCWMPQRAEREFLRAFRRYSGEA